VSGAVPTARQTFDHATFAILLSTFESIADGMGENLVQSAHSTLIREARDGSCALLNATGEVIAQAKHIPIQMCSLSLPLRSCLEKYEGQIQPGEAFFTNDAFAGGQHLQDLILFTPVFADGELLAFAGSIAHHVDIGGGAAGMTYDAREYYQEGLRFSSCKIDVQRDLAPGGFLHDLIGANFRQPQTGLGDLRAQLSANYVGEQRLLAIVAKYGVEVVRRAIEDGFDYAEGMIRRAIEAVPDGVYEAEDYVDGGVFDPRPIRVHVSVEVAGSDVSVDFSGTDEQVHEFLNVPYGSTMSTTLSVLKMLLDPEGLVPANEGCFRPMSIRAPRGSFVNPAPPAATRARMCGAYRIFDAVLSAFQQALPGAVPAQGFHVNTTVGFSQQRGGDYRIFIEDIGGGWGATPVHDGADMVDTPLSNCRITPVEALEREHAYLLVERYALLPDSGGAGRYRGGLGMERIFRVRDDGVNFFAYADRHERAPSGTAGGAPGTKGRFEHLSSAGAERLPSKCSLPIAAGDAVRVVAGGGGGFGPPSERDADAVAADIATGRISAAGAITTNEAPT
jgi:N-methylhydantoinase B